MNQPRTRRDFLKALGLASISAACGRKGQNHGGLKEPPRPNIVIILADDLGWADVGFNGGKIATRHLDRLAREGVRLDHFYTTPLCSPTRAGLMTGREPIRYGMESEVITPWRRYGLPLTERTLADLVAGSGYERRGAVGKWHLGHYKKEYLPLNRGFTHYTGCYNGVIDYFTHIREGERDWHRNFEPYRDEGYVTDMIGRESARFIEESPDGKPFFLYTAFTAPHLPLQAKKEDIDRYAWIADEKERIYAAMVDSMDQAVGQILKALDDRGITENTFVLFLSDNGAIHLGDNGPWRSVKGSVYEGGIRVPAAVRWPAGIQGGRSVQDMMGYIDIYSTVKRIAGATGCDPNPLDGLDMLDVIRGLAKAPKRDWFSTIAQNAPERTALCDGNWKLIVLGGSALDIDLDRSGFILGREIKAKSTSAVEDQPVVELYNLAVDPGEKTDWSAEHPEIVRRLLDRMKEFRRLKLEGVPGYMEDRQGFKAPKDWIIE